MRQLLLVAAAAAAFATPAAAVSVLSMSVTGAAGSVSVFNAADSLLELDLELRNGSFATIVATRTAGDADLVDLNAFVDLFGGINKLVLGTSANAPFASNGTAVAAFSTASLSGGANSVTIDFSPTEFVSVDLGGALGDGTPFVLDFSRVAVGDSFTITFSAVPAPAALALFGLGFVALATRRR